MRAPLRARLLGFPCEVSMGRDAYLFRWWPGEGEAACEAVLAKADIASIRCFEREAYLGERPRVGLGLTALSAALLGPAGGAAAMLGTTRFDPAFGREVVLAFEAVDGCVELTLGPEGRYNGSLGRQGASTYLADFRRHRDRYAS